MARTTQTKRKVRFNTVSVKYFDKRQSISEWRKSMNQNMTRTNGAPRKSILKKREP